MPHTLNIFHAKKPFDQNCDQRDAQVGVIAAVLFLIRMDYDENLVILVSGVFPSVMSEIMEGAVGKVCL